jgi:hypothetical protein
MTKESTRAGRGLRLEYVGSKVSEVIAKNDYVYDFPADWAKAPRDSREWAEVWRHRMLDHSDGLFPTHGVQRTKKGKVVVETRAVVPTEPTALKNFLETLEQGVNAGAFTRIGSQAGAKFQTLDEFIENPRPNGLGIDMTVFNAVCGARATKVLRMAAVAMAGDRRAENAGTGSNQHELKPAPGAGISKEAGRQEQRHRAIERSPRVIRDLWYDSQIPDKLAARFGPDTKSAAGRDRKAQTDAAAGQVETWLRENPRPNGADLFAAKEQEKWRLRLRDTATQALGVNSSRITIRVDAPKTAAEQIKAKCDREFIQELIANLSLLIK